MVTPIMLPKIGWFVMPRHKDKISLGEWHKSDGQEVEKGEIIAGIETAKADLELEAPATGLLFSLKKNKEKVKMKDILGVIVDTAEEFEIFKRQNPSGEAL
jgi:pyruvate/2-oxoglutarate dehydrogenase complex dihydrolipoamide acyltransferase (E2) component